MRCVCGLCLSGFSVAIPATVWCWCCPYFIGSRLVFQDAWRWLPNSEEGSWIPGKEREERFLASAMSTDVRKDGTCKFCSESNVWTRWRCRRCYHDIPAGLRGKHRQAIAGRTGEWSAVSSTSSQEEDRKSKSLEAGNNELRARLEEKKGGEGAQGGQGLPSRREEWGMEEEWGMDMDVEEEVESRKKLDEQKKKVAEGVARNRKILVFVERGTGKPRE